MKHTRGPSGKARPLHPAPPAGPRSRGRRRALRALPVLSALPAIGLAGCGSLERLPIRTPDVPFVITPQEVVVAMLELAAVGPDDNVYDLGCGDGRIPITAASRFGAHGVGVDLDARLVKAATAAAHVAGVSERVQFRVEDLFTTDVRPATVVTLYLLPELMERLEPGLKAQLRPGSRIVSHQFLMGGDWPPQATRTLPGAVLYLWTA
jgi:SAM-dependent methyltransferase